MLQIQEILCYTITKRKFASFQDMFPDIDIVRSVQNELDQVIEEGVVRIVQLLRNSESGTSSGAVKYDEDAFEAKSRQQNRFKKWKHGTDKSFSDLMKTNVKLDTKRGKLTDQLINQGLLTKNMMEELKREWANEDEGYNNQKDK